MSGFRPDALDAPLAALEKLPRGLWLQGIVNGIGRPPGRLAGVHALREALLAGTLPQESAWIWPEDAVLATFAPELAELELPRYCKDQPDIAEQILGSLLWHTDRIADTRDRQGMDETAAIEHALAAFRDDWSGRRGELDELIHVFGELGEAARSDRWDSTRGLLKSEGWQAMLRIRALLEQLPRLRALIRSLGRARLTDEFDENHAPEMQVFEQATVTVAQQVETHVPGLPGETQGIRRSGDISRMLASETALLRHPKLRLIWFARHAERILLSYEDRDTLVQTVHAQAQAWRPSLVRRPERKLEAGPIVVCVDTSGSMRGGCEQVAKAVVLEAMRTALAQRRACHVFAFSGPGEVAEMELRCDAGGIAAAIAFLSQTFHGGTEVSEALDAALARLDGEGWQLADLLLASDGEFGATPAVLDRLEDAKRKLGLRVQGVLVGDRETIGMLRVCDDVLWVQDWRRFGGNDAGLASPVHSQRLTALYFPNAVAHSAGTRTPGDGHDAGEP